MKKQPRLTVLMPVYNVEQYVEEAINSVLRQTYSNFILLVLDDCSTDGTAQIVHSISDDRISYYKQPVNVGLAENLNTGVEMAKTEFISRMDGDDILEKNCLEKQIRFLDTHLDVDICSVGFNFFGTKTSTVFFPEKHEDIKSNHLFGCNVIVPMLRKRIFTDNNLRYKTSAFPAEDYRMWAECLCIGVRMHTLQEILFYYRTHADQISTERRERQIQKTNEVRLFVLEWLSTDFTEEQKDIFINKFIPGKIESKADVKYLHKFVRLIEEHNRKHKNFSGKSLHKRLKYHVSMSAYYSALELYFNNGFSLRNYSRFFFSGLFLHIPFGLNLKILAKSLLYKKK